MESTGLVEAYVFEAEPASSEDTQSAYLGFVDESNLCIFLVDNADGVPAAVLSEEKRAKDKQLRLLYIFCDESKKDATPMQEAVKISLSQKYFVVHEFSDMVSTAYDSVIKDIIAVYKRKEDRFSISPQNEEAGSDGRQLNVEAYTLPINRLSQFPQVRSVLTKTILPEKATLNMGEETLLENQLSEHLKVVLFQKAYDETIIDKISDEVLKVHSKEIHELLRVRFRAQRYYYASKYEECLGALQDAIKLH